MADAPFNPLDKLNLGKSVAGALLERPVGSLPPDARFVGAGIYAIYYTGDFPPYNHIVGLNRERFEQPIYVGKAVPKGARKGGFTLGKSPGNVLYSRLREHAKSIMACDSLKVEHFSCRYLISDDIWIPLGEALLIEQFKPLWNILIDGFGNHPTGKRRAGQYRSRWDTLHPGRAWAAKLPENPESPDKLIQDITDLFAGKAVATLSPEEAVVSEDGEQEEE